MWRTQRKHKNSSSHHHPLQHTEMLSGTRLREKERNWKEWNGKAWVGKEGMGGEREQKVIVRKNEKVRNSEGNVTSPLKTRDWILMKSALDIYDNQRNSIFVGEPRLVTKNHHYSFTTQRV